MLSFFTPWRNRKSPVFICGLTTFKPHAIGVKDVMWVMGNGSSCLLSLEAGIAQSIQRFCSTPEMFIHAVGPTEPSIWWDFVSRVNQQKREVVNHLHLAPSLSIHAASILSRHVQGQISCILLYFIKWKNVDLSDHHPVYMCVCVCRCVLPSLNFF